MMNNDRNLYTPTESFFNAFRQLPEGAADRVRCSLIDRMFHLAVEERLKDSQTRFSGFFAKVDYLLKQNADKMPDKSLSLAVNDLRIRLKDYRQLTSKPGWYGHAVSVLSSFIGIIYNVRVPDDLVSRYPYVRKSDYHYVLEKGQTLRVVVDSFDDDIIDATREDTGGKCHISYSNAQTVATADRSYLKRLLSAGTQLNLIRPKANNDGVIFSDYIIVNPDYLVDISSIAACFDDYGEASPYTYLINKLKPSVASEPIILGNFASQLLDETVNGRFRDIGDSFTRFARHNAIALAACPPGLDFLSKATAQLDNIQFAINRSLPEATASNSDVILEPSFFSEALGLQGRMDYLQLDFHVLIEQKSGRGGYGSADDGTPKARTSHYVQLLLYRALLHYGGYSRGSLYSFLLYSKYPYGLLAVGNSPDLLFKALRIRNQIAWMEVWLSHGNHVSMLDKLTPERINPKGHGYGWEHFVRPQLSATLDAIHRASPLERAYYYRFLRFVQTEQVLSKLGNRSKEGSGFASVWNDTLAERLAAGNIYGRLRMINRHHNDEGQVDAVLLALPDDADIDVSNFREGDIVILYSYNPAVAREPLATRHIVFRGTIACISDDHIDITLRSPQAGDSVFKGDVWAVEHDYMESSSTALYRGLQSFLTAPVRRRQLLLSQRKPEIDFTKHLNGDYTNETTGDVEFNVLVLKAKRAKDFFLIVGPPGTGKTSYGMLNVLEEQLSDGCSSVLLMAYTNRAVDEICQKIDDAGIDFIRIGSLTGCAERFRQHMLERRTESCASVADIRQMIHSTRVFCGTTTSFNSNIQLLGMKPFDLAIIDEASQILEPQLIGLLSAQVHGEPSIRKFVLIGDEKQLPAVVQQSDSESAIDNPLLAAAGITDCRMSLFERLMRTWRADGEDNDYCYTLTRQGRMHLDIEDFPNHAFYGGRLTVVPLMHQIEPSASQRLEFITYSTSETMVDDEGVSDKTNKTEARIIAGIVWKVWQQTRQYFDPLQTVGVIVPYRNQVSTVRRAIADIEKREGISGLSSITIDTVERYQGSQRDVIIYGFTVKHDYQLDFLADNQYVDPVSGAIIDRKLNVAMTRAMKRLFLVGNPDVLMKNPVFKKFLEYVRSN